jgi:hypothetical protein
MARLTTGKQAHSGLVTAADFIKAAPNLVNETEERVSGAAAITLDISVYQSVITTGGTAGSEDVNIGDGTGAVVGQRKLVTLGTRTDGSDVVNLDHANIHNASGTQCTNVDLDAANEFVLVEWTGSEWQIIYANATVAP